MVTAERNNVTAGATTFPALVRVSERRLSRVRDCFSKPFAQKKTPSPRGWGIDPRAFE